MENKPSKFLTVVLSTAFCLSPATVAGQQQSTTTVPVQQGAKQTSQAPSQTSPVAIQATSDLVRIDAEVTDGAGKPVKNLRADQFTLTDNGRPQKISIFSYSDIESLETAAQTTFQPVTIPVDNEGPAAMPAGAVSDAAQDRRMIVLFFDLTSMQTDDLIRAHDAAEKFLKTQLGHADLVAVVTFGVRLGILANFTNDRAALEKAVAQIVPGAASQLGAPLYAAAQNGEYDVQEYTGAAFTADETEFNVFNTDQKLAAVESLVNTLAQIPGRKALVEFTGGITQTGEENRTALRAATDAANRADVSIYSIDARGLYTTAPGGDVTTNAATGNSMFTGASVFHQTDQREDSRDTLATLSTDTGGRAFFDLGDLSDAFPEIQRENNGYYLLGYYLGPDVKRDGSWRSIRVKVNARGVHVRYREGYYAPRDFQHFQKEDREEQLDEAMNSADPILELPIAVETLAFRLNEQQTYVPIAAKISSGALNWAEKQGKREAAFDFAAEVRAASSGQVVANLRDTIQVHLDAEEFKQVHQANLLYQGGVVLSPGNYHLKLVARENESGKIGTFEENLAIPASQPGHVSLSSVMLSSQLVPVVKTSEVETKGQGLRAKIADSPLEMGGEKIVPSVTRYFNRDQTLYVFFQAYFPGKVDAIDPANLRGGLIFFRDGVQINSTPLLAPAQIDPKTRTASFRISLPLAKLPAGRYTVQAVVIAAGTQQSAFGRAYLALMPRPQPSARAVDPTSAAPVRPANSPAMP